MSNDIKKNFSNDVIFFPLNLDLLYNCSTDALSGSHQHESHEVEAYQPTRLLVYLAVPELRMPAFIFKQVLSLGHQKAVPQLFILDAKLGGEDLVPERHLLRQGYPAICILPRHDAVADPELFPPLACF